MKNKLNSIATEDVWPQREPQYAYQLSRVTYLPHYTKSAFVGPGYPDHNLREYTASELEAAGATKVKTLLFARGPKAAGRVE